MNRLSMDPKNIRVNMHAAYERYVHGIDRYPRMKLTADPEEFPRKSRGIARALFRAWEVIDEDREFFHEAVLASVDAVPGIRDPDGGSRLIITRVGRNAVNMAIITPGTPPSASLGTYDRAEFVREMEGVPLNLTGGGSVMLVDGWMQGEPEGVIVRRSNAAGVFYGTPQSTTIEDVATSLV